uniref:Candidate secreted effector n=1 Tax=Meloidogyne incognita TaxID=6306 RepID=A0A914MD34_MELIC
MFVFLLGILRRVLVWGRVIKVVGILNIICGSSLSPCLRPDKHNTERPKIFNIYFPENSEFCLLLL